MNIYELMLIESQDGHIDVVNQRAWADCVSTRMGESPGSLWRHAKNNYHKRGATTNTRLAVISGMYDVEILPEGCAILKITPEVRFKLFFLDMLRVL